jgi:hypothetical protein
MFSDDSSPRPLKRTRFILGGGITALSVAMLIAVMRLVSTPASANAPSSAANPSATGEWEPLITTWPIQTAHSVMLANGTVGGLFGGKQAPIRMFPASTAVRRPAARIAAAGCGWDVG